MSDGGKGSRPRPFSVPKSVFDENFEAIFGKKKKEPVEQESVDRNPTDEAKE
jgi:hypothetical protein